MLLFTHRGLHHRVWGRVLQGEMKPLLEYSPTDFQRVMDINVVGAFNVLQAVAKVMAEQGGGVVVNTSRWVCVALISVVCI